MKDLHDALGISKGHASEVLNGKTEPGEGLALRIYRKFGVKLGPISHATDAEIAALEKMRARGSA